MLDSLEDEAKKLMLFDYAHKYAAKSNEIIKSSVLDLIVKIDLEFRLKYNYGCDCKLSKSSSALLIYNKSKDNWQFKPKVGSLAIYNYWDGDRELDHGILGLISKVIDDRQFLTLEAMTMGSEIIFVQISRNLNYHYDGLRFKGFLRIW